MESLKARLFTAAIGVPAVIAVLVLSEFFSWIMTVTITLICVLMTFEILSAKKLHKKPILLITCILYALIQPLVINTPYKLLPVYLFVLILFFLMVAMSQKIEYADVAFALVGTVVIVLGTSSVLLLTSYLEGYVSFAFIISIGVSWLSDAGAYFAGVFLGKHKLCPRVSPKKTVEGFVGGIIIGTLSSLAIGVVFSFIYSGVTFNYIALLVMGFFGSLISVLGDLTFSLIKRSCNIKDYGSIFPGHGGMLDRFDSVILIAPLMYLVCVYFPVVIV